MASRVALVKQKDYGSGLLDSIARAVELSGFDMSKVRGKKVLLKPNLLGAFPPEKGITTEPAFLVAVARFFQSHGAVVAAGDSPNGIFEPDLCWKVSGLAKACTDADVEIIKFEKSGSVERNGMMLARAALDADIVVNLPRFKTHGLTVMTLGVKNLFGCVNGVAKARHHRQLSDRMKFADLLVRIADSVKPQLTLVDAIAAMEGEGPSSGRLVNLGAIIAGENVHDVDAACCAAIGLAPTELDTLIEAEKLGLWNRNSKIDIVGDYDGAPLKVDFALPSTYTKGRRDWWLSKFVLDRIWSNVSSQPVIDRKKCKICLYCFKSCPVMAISQPERNKPPRVSESKCMQCLCCHEVCPHTAIYLRQSTMIRVAKFIWKFRRD